MGDGPIRREVFLRRSYAFFLCVLSIHLHNVAAGGAGVPVRDGSGRLEKTWLRRGSIIFHYAIILSFFGHIVGLLTPDSVMHALRISMEAHTVVAVGMGMILAPLVVVGLGILLWRRTTNEHVWATTVPMDVLVVVLILINGCTGFYQAYVAHFPVFVTVGPWLRSLVVFRPDVVLMETVPLFLQIHVVSAFTLFALIPFSRLVHIFSVPVTYALRPFQIYRRRYAGL